jgi:hypothetical protein
VTAPRSQERNRQPKQRKVSFLVQYLDLQERDANMDELREHSKSGESIGFRRMDEEKVSFTARSSLKSSKVELPNR